MALLGCSVFLAAFGYACVCPWCNKMVKLNKFAQPYNLETHFKYHDRKDQTAGTHALHVAWRAASAANVRRIRAGGATCPVTGAWAVCAAGVVWCCCSS